MMIAKSITDFETVDNAFKQYKKQFFANLDNNSTIKINVLITYKY
jgi:hypothetical protein